MNYLLYDQDHLFEQIAAGNELAFRKIFHGLNAKLYPFVLKLTCSESATEDIVQETFLRLWLHRSEVGKMDHPVSWLYTVASNLSLSWLRAHAAEIRRLQQMKIPYSTIHEPAIEHLSVKEIQSLIAKAVELLPPKRQQIYRLSREQGLNHKEIAKRLQLSPNTIKNQLVSALKFIKDYLRRASDVAIPLLVLLFFY